MSSLVKLVRDEEAKRLNSNLRSARTHPLSLTLSLARTLLYDHSLASAYIFHRSIYRSITAVFG